MNSIKYKIFPINDKNNGIQSTNGLNETSDIEKRFKSLHLYK